MAAQGTTRGAGERELTTLGGDGGNGRYEIEKVAMVLSGGQSDGWSVASVGGVDQSGEERRRR